jgi:hypothetical protein
MSGTTTPPDDPTIAADIGLNLLRLNDPGLTGAGVTVAQVEASDGSTGTTAFEASGTNDPGASFTYLDGTQSSTTYNDGVVGTASAHADYVASFFYGATLYQGAPTGVAPGVAAVDVYFAADFLTSLAGQTAASFAPAVVNMSFTYSSGTDANITYDTDAALLSNTVFVAAAGNSGTPASPSTAWNVISVASSTASVAVGAAGLYADKPDISAPQSETSYTAPIVSGAAALLVQAGRAGFAGWTAGEEAAAVDARTVKALLLNGAVKPSDYFTNGYAPSANGPLSAEYGSGVVNVSNAVANLAAGQVAAGLSTTLVNGYPFSNLSAQLANTTSASAGWNLGTLYASDSHTGVDGYAVNLAADTPFVATVTWYSHLYEPTLEQIDPISLDLYDESTNTVVASSAASASSVQQIYFTPTVAGRYDLYVALEGTTYVLTGGEKYALAFAETSIACFAEGTRIATPGAERPIESLREGDSVTLARGGGAARIREITRRTVLHPDRTTAPLRIAPGTFGPGAPARPLLLSPEHAVHAEIDGVEVLVPVWALENGTSIARLRPAAVTYFHILLDRHEVLLAEGLACESLLEGSLTPAAPRVTQGPRVERLRLLANGADRRHGTQRRAVA